MESLLVKDKQNIYNIINIYNIDDFPYNKLCYTAINDNNHRGQSYINDFATFDIETSSITKTISKKETFRRGHMYVWQMCVHGYVIIGRTWEEWLYFIKKLIDVLKLNDKRKMAIYVHNLGYEFQFMRRFLEKNIAPLRVFAPQPRKPLRVDCYGLEFRCSWKLSNMSLFNFTDTEISCKYVKRDGEYNYTKIRTPFDKLSRTEKTYTVIDVLGLYQAVKSKMNHDNDNIITIPMTSTGYVRRDMRRSCRTNRHYRSKIFNRCRLDEDSYIQLKSASRGGDTHANIDYRGKIIHDLDSFDIQSSYPYQLMTKKFPMESFTLLGDIDNIEELDRYINNGYALLFDLYILNPKHKRDVSMPYIPKDKCAAVIKGDNYAYDNGRIYEAEMVSIPVTDIDYDIIMRHYDNEGIAIKNLRIAKKGYIPNEIKTVILDYFFKKSEIKYRKESGDEITELDEYLYNKSKNKLNAIFGMMFTDPIHDIIPYEGDWKDIIKPNIIEALEKYYNNKNSFLYYAWGVWTTAHARKDLDDIRVITDKYGTVYCDTDSSKCKLGALPDIEERNIMIRKLSEEFGAYVDINDKRYYMGEIEQETANNPIEKFITLGAKKYCYVDKKGLHVTVSGVSKKNGAKELGTIDNFKNGFIWVDAGGLDSYYDDNENIEKITVDGKTFTSSSNVCMVNGTYKLSNGEDYNTLIDYLYG